MHRQHACLCIFNSPDIRLTNLFIITVMNISLKKAALAALAGSALITVMDILGFITFFFRMLFESYFPFNFLNFCSLVAQGITILCFAAITFFFFTFWKQQPE